MSRGTRNEKKCERKRKKERTKGKLMLKGQNMYYKRKGKKSTRVRKYQCIKERGGRNMILGPLKKIYV
jgi:hypothetical protein